MLRVYLVQKENCKFEQGRYIRPKRNEFIQRALDLSGMNEMEINHAIYFDSVHFKENTIQ